MPTQVAELDYPSARLALDRSSDSSRFRGQRIALII